MYNERDLVEYMAYIRLVEKKEFIVENYILSEEGIAFFRDLKEKIITDIIKVCHQKKVNICDSEIEAIVDKIFADVLGIQL